MSMYRQYTHIYHVNKNFYFECDLITINHLTALALIFTKTLKKSICLDILQYYKSNFYLYDWIP